MIDRRAFVQRGLAGSAWALLGGGLTLAGGNTAARATVRAHLAIFERRFAAGRRFARTMQRQGIPTRAITGDVTSIWLDELYPLWKQQPAVIAGLTTYAPLFCLERLAWDHGLRVLQRNQHETDATHGHEPFLYSWVIGPRRSA